MAKAQRAQTPAPTSKKSAEAGTSAPATGTDRVAARAYEIWKESGCPNGKDREHWFQAERELRGGAARR